MKGFENFNKEDAEGLKSLMWCIGALNQFKDFGLIEGLKFETTPKGVSGWDQLDADWKPKDD